MLDIQLPISHTGVCLHSFFHGLNTKASKMHCSHSESQGIPFVFLGQEATTFFFFFWGGKESDPYPSYIVKQN